MSGDFATMTKKTKQHEQTFRFFIHRSTVEKLEQITKKHYSQNGEQLVLEVIAKVKSS